jgi:ribosomal protein S18 acetylase RimI-like enzyme
MVSLSAIDRERFGIITARDSQLTVDSLSDTLRFCRENGVQLLVARCAAQDLHAAQAVEAAGGRLMDTLVYYVRALERPFPDERHHVSVRPLSTHDADGVRQVAAASFRGYLGHYHADPRLDRTKCDETYTSWAERSCVDRSVASKVLVAESEGRVAGFLTLLERGPEEQEIVLNGVHPDFQRHGIYRGLVLGAMTHARAAGANRLTVSTQLINTGVQKTWSRLGFELWRSYYTFHLWFDSARN